MKHSKGIMKKGKSFRIEYIVEISVYNYFISAFKDENPLHTDKSFAQSKGFSNIVMHGNILNGFLSNFIGMHLPVKDVIIISQIINYKKPVFLSDILFLNAEIIDIFESVGVIEFNFYFENTNNIKVAKGKFSIKLI